ncbi:MAG TPA: TolC family outer membrane protein, partial [Bradyrhizobium sp.]|nr:TolC family outer membrane protein [Bradyrhizobium sp.]
ALFCNPVMADTLEAALAYAYVNNPQINSQRAVVRATDEGVPTALAGYRPRAVATANVGMQSLSTTIREIGSTTPPNAPASYFTQSGVNTPHGFGASVTQNLLNGFQTANRTRLAESQVFAARETLRNIEQAVLLNATTAYMNLLRDAGILELQRSNLEVLTEQLRQTNQRLQSGNVTATDVSQAEARLNVGRTQLFTAEANYASSRAVYRQVIGLDPGRLAPAAPVDRFTPNTLAAAIATGIAQNPLVAIAQHNVDVALHQVKVAEGALYPTVSLQGNVQKNYETALNSLQSFTASGSVQYSAPLYQGGAEYAAIRQAKETQGQKRLDLSVARDQARMGVAQAWAQLIAAKNSIESTKSQVKAAEAALNGVREEARLGQRTTLDTLNAQQELVNARIAMVVAQRDRLVNSYSLLAAVGRLSPQVLGLPVSTYDPQVHYHQVRDAWVGVRTPDGR